MRKQDGQRAFLFMGLLLAATSTWSQTPFFPAQTFGKHDSFVVGWYSQQLTGLQEPALPPLAKDSSVEVYRFLWLRSFHHPIAIRMQIKADGTASLTTKVGGGAGGYQPKPVLQNATAKLSKEQTDVFTRTLRKDAFWTLPGTDSVPGGCDGAEWIIEGVAQGKYHAISRWSPTRGAARELGLLALHFANVNVPADEMY